MRAARVEATAGRRVEVAGDATRNARGDAASCQLGYRLHQALGVGMEWLCEQLGGGRLLDHVAGVHHVHAVGRLAHHAQRVGDEDDRGAFLLHQPVQQAQDLVLDGDIQRGARLIGDQQFRVGGQRHADTHPLAHTTAELDGVAVQQALRVGQRHLFQGDDGLFPDLALREAAVGRADVLDHCSQLLADGKHRVQGGGRVLEDHRDAAAPHLSQTLLTHLEDVLAFEKDLAAGDARRRGGQNAQDGLHSGGFAAARFAHQPHLLTGVDVEVHAIQHLEDAAVDLELDAQILDFKQAWRGHLRPPRRRTCRAGRRPTD